MLTAGYWRVDRGDGVEARAILASLSLTVGLQTAKLVRPSFGLGQNTVGEVGDGSSR